MGEHCHWGLGVGGWGRILTSVLTHFPSLRPQPPTPNPRGHWRAFFALLVVVGLMAGEAGPVVELSASPAEVAVGETVVVTVTYRWPHAWSVAAEPDPAADFHNLFVTAAPPAERASSGEEERRTYRYTVAAARSGAWQLPRPSLTAQGPAGPSTTQAPAVIVQVGAESAPPKLPSARPLILRPPVALATNQRWWWLGGAVAVLSGAVLWWRLSRRQALSGPTPWEILASELDRVGSASDAKDAGARISLAVRRYAGALWRFDGPGQTTREVGATLRRLRAGAIADDEARDFLRLLSRLDDLRWSPGEAPSEAMHELVTLARSWAAGVQARLDAEAAARAKAKRPAAEGA